MGVSESVLQEREELRLNSVVFLLSDVATSNERLGVQGANRTLRLDEVVHERLGHRRIVTLVVAATTV